MELSPRTIGAMGVAGAAAAVIATSQRWARPSLAVVPCTSELPDTGVALVFGLGFTGLRAAVAFRRRGWKVYGTVRSPGTAVRLTSDHGIHALVFDSTADDSENQLDAIVTAILEATHVLITAAPTVAGDPVLAHSRLSLAITEAAKAKTVVWCGYLSTVGVYGDHGGAEVTEDTPPMPKSERGKRRLAAEAKWQATGFPVAVLRLPGIYGPGRGPLQKVRTGTARRVVKEGQIFSRIHVDDIIQAILCSAARPRSGAVYNVVDDEPTAAHEVITYACTLLNVTPPPLVPFADAELSAMARSFYSECRYIRNARLKRELGVTLLYPTYREGLAAQLKEESRLAGGGSILASCRQLLCNAVASARRVTRQFVQHPTCVILVDNGSVRAASTLKLRALAAQLEKDPRMGSNIQVHATSARWSDRVDSADLCGVPAELLGVCLRRLAANGCTSMVIVPYFFGPSTTVTDYCPEVARAAQLDWPHLRVSIAPPLWCPCPYLQRLLPPRRCGRGQDDRIAQALCASVLRTAQKQSLKQPIVLVCDHGTPTHSVHDVREVVTAQVREILDQAVSSVSSCSMERREGIDYAFNDPLLETALGAVCGGSQADSVIVALLFLGPGKHAGAGGDIASIVTSSRCPLRVHVTDVIGSDPLIRDILVDRAQQAIQLL